MLAQVDQTFDTLPERARAGDTVALGCLLDSCRTYLKLIAASLLRNAPRASVDVSDVSACRTRHAVPTERGREVFAVPCVCRRGIGWPELKAEL
jgi:hypothetical protein